MFRQILALDKWIACLIRDLLRAGYALIDVDDWNFLFVKSEVLKNSRTSGGAA
ncbi:hypothetical protein CCP2SC5_2730001 [Azospirillaceae bacterium]